jgi:DNA modification methylase
LTEAKNDSNTLPINQILCGDCVEIMKPLPTEYIDLTMFSPPYWGLRDYGVKGQLGLEGHPTEYIVKMVQICQEIKRLLKRSGSMYVVIGDTYFGGNGTYGKPKDWQDLHMHQNYPEGEFFKQRNKLASNWLQPKQLMGIPWRLAMALQEDGWILRNDIIWNKPNHMPSSVRDRLTNAYEHIFHFVKSRKYYYDLDAIREKSVTQPLAKNPLKKVNNTEEETEAPHRSSKDVTGRYEGKFTGFAEKSEEFSSPKARTQRTIKTGMHHGSSLTIGRASHYLNQQIEGNPEGKNPGDTFQTQKEPYIGNNPHRMRLEPEQHVALDPSAPMDLSHPLGKNPSDEIKFKGDETKLAGRLAKSRDRYRALGVPEGHPLGQNPSDFWSITTKQFKGAHFAVYPEAICVRPILSSCPPDGIVLDPMCGSGTTLAVAKKLGRKYIGIELNPTYIEIANKRLSEIPEKLNTFF